MRFFIWPVIIGTITILLMLFLHSRMVLNVVDMGMISPDRSGFSIGQYLYTFLVDLSVHYERLVKDSSSGHGVILLSMIVFVVFFVYSLLLLSRNTALLYRERARSKTMLASISDGLFVTDNKGVVEFINPAAERLLECDNSSVVGRPIEDVFRLISTGTHVPVENGVRRCLRDGEPYSLRRGDTSVITCSEKYLDVEHEAAPIIGHKERMTGAVMVFKDVTHRRRIAQELEWAAAHDPLTGLVNRREFGNRIVEALVTAQLDKKSHTLLCMDLDKFKIVNDQGGHAAGDALLRQVVEEIQKVLRSGDVFARLGGDEFAVLLAYCPMKKAIHLSHNILKAVKAMEFSWEGRVFKIGVSIGVVEVNKSSKSDSYALSLADKACYAAKEDGRNCVRAITPEGVMLRSGRKPKAETVKAKMANSWC